MCTPLHVDRVGWNTRLESGKWVPTFKNAKFVLGRADYDHDLKVDTDPKTAPANAGSFRDSVLPVVEAGLSQLVDGAASSMSISRSSRRPALHRARSPSSANRTATRACSAATSCIMPCRSIFVPRFDGSF